MKLRELKQQIDMELENRDSHFNPEVRVVIKGGGMGATPSEPVKYAGTGIDWDSWQFMIYTETKLSKTIKK
jgi:hypothetical protein